MKKRIYSKSIANKIKSILKGDDWNFFFDEQKGLFKFDLSLKGKLKKICYIIEVSENDYIVFAISPIGADEEDRDMMAAMAELVCRLNYDLKSGSFELDMRDGEIRFKNFVDCNGIMPSDEIIRNSIHCPAAMFNHYGKGILEIIFNNATAKDAIAKCKKSPTEEFSERFWEEYLSEDCGREILYERLDKLLGVEESDSQDTEESDSQDADISSESKEGEPDTKTDLFESEGGVA